MILCRLLCNIMRFWMKSVKYTNLWVYHCPLDLEIADSVFDVISSLTHKTTYGSIHIRYLVMFPTACYYILCFFSKTNILSAVN